MFREYTPLRFVSLPPFEGARVASVTSPEATLDSPALSVMTDFTQVPAATIEADARISEAEDFMRWRHVRALIATNAADEVVGVLTSTDVLGEKLIKFALENEVKREEIRVSDLMTPRTQIELLVYEEVRHAHVGHIVATLRNAGRQHFLVGEGDPVGKTVRGIFSLLQIARQLGIELEATSFAQTFSEIERLINSSPDSFQLVSRRY